MLNLLKERRDTKNKAQRITPGFCCYGIIDECILRCEMCFKWKGQPDITGRKQPSIRDWKRCTTALRELVDKDFVINFGGGEALLLNGLLDIVRFAAKLGFSTNIISNGWLIDREMAKRIANSGLSSINLSLDSLNEKKHDKMRGVNGVYRRVFNAIDYLSKDSPGVNIGICSVIYDYNMDDILPLLDWANSNDQISHILFMVPMQPNNTFPAVKDWHKNEYSYLWPKDIKKACGVVDEILRLKNKGYKVSNSVYQLEAFRSYLEFPDKFVKKSPCNFDRAFHVSSVGDVFLCYRHQMLGNICRDDIRKLWYSQTAQEARRNIAECTENCHFLLNCFFEEDYPFVVEN